LHPFDGVNIVRDDRKPSPPGPAGRIDI